MAKTKTQWVCRECGRTTLREMGRCPQCGAWGSLEAEIVAPSGRSDARALLHPSGASTPEPLAQVSSDAEARLHLPIGEFARVLGGGIVPGSVMLVGGDPGIGKSTLMLQMALRMAEQNGPVLYVSGEESARQIKMRANRLEDMPPGAFEALYLVTETRLETIMQHIDAVNPQLVIIDSIQTTYSGEVQSMAGSVTQVRECAARLTGLAKATGIAVFLIGHVTKEGTLAGPRVLEHIVDTVLQLEGDNHHSYRLLRGIKNRFGATNEVGVFEMQQKGMVEVTNPSEVFLAERLVNAPGSCIVVTMEGTRPLLVEIQALTTTTTFGNPRRTANGVDFNRLLLVSAVATRRAGLRLGDQDVFLNVVGGMTIEEPAADLAMALALASSVRDLPVPADLIAIGELGLSGEVRTVSQLTARLREAQKLGFRRALVPKSVRRHEPYPEGIEVIAVRSIREAIAAGVGGREAG